MDFGTYPQDSDFAGYQYIGLHNLLDKTHKLTVNNSYRRDTEGSMRIPIFPQDINSPGTIFYDYVFNKTAPGQTRLHCYPATNNQRQCYANLGKPTAVYSGTTPVGHNTITNYFNDAGALLGLKNKLNGHAMRRLCITKMVNGGVGLSEIMATARHSSVAATLTYQKRTEKGTCVKLAALGMQIPHKTDA